MTVGPIARGKFLSFAYTWSLAEEEQEGLLLVVNGTNIGKATGSWGDSWHQSASLLVLSGSVDASGGITLNGTFEAPPEPDWGWRIAVSQQSRDELQLTMYVIPWNKPEELAVQADYRRVDR